MFVLARPDRPTGTHITEAKIPSPKALQGCAVSDRPGSGSPPIPPGLVNREARTQARPPPTWSVSTGHWWLVRSKRCPTCGIKLDPEEPWQNRFRGAVLEARPATGVTGVSFLARHWRSRSTK